MASIDSPLVNPWKPSEAWVEHAMREATLGEARLIYHSSNYVFLVDLEHPEHGRGYGVYKPASGEQPLYDFPDDLYHREIAAYEFARLLGWDIVPPTVEAEGPHGVGSVQLFIEHDPRQHYFQLREVDTYDWQFVRFAAFDLAANNADRKGGHLLLDPQGTIWGIDNGLCFNRYEKFRTVIWDYAGTEIPAEWLADLARAAEAIRDCAPLAQPLLDRLAEGEAEALVGRIERLVTHPVLPDMESYDRRVVPWPML